MHFIIRVQKEQLTWGGGGIVQYGDSVMLGQGWAACGRGTAHLAQALCLVGLRFRKMK